jgi:hypothetical protein
MTDEKCEILKSQLRAAWIEWLYMEDESLRNKQEKDIVSLQFKIFHQCDDIIDTFQDTQDEIKKLPIPDWAKTILN